MTDVNQGNANAKKPRLKAAEHDFIDANGNVVEDGETATGYRYTLMANGDVFDWQWDQANEAERRMLALFGSKTLATNETSAVRNNPKNQGVDTAGEQMEALRDRFAMVRSGQWVDKTREGGFAKIDKSVLAKAICQVLIAKGKITDAELDDTYAAKLQLLEEDATYLRKSRQVTEVQAAYSALMGKPVATIEDL